MMHRFLTGGESHGPCLTVIVEGFPAGLPLPEEEINRDLVRRQGGYGRSGRQHIERDEAQFLGGVEGGVSTGGPIVMQVANRDHANFIKKEHPRLTTPRPGHADLVGAVKYRLSDMRTALERSSARETAARTAAGAVAKVLLKEFGFPPWTREHQRVRLPKRGADNQVAFRASNPGLLRHIRPNAD